MSRKFDGKNSNKSLKTFFDRANYSINSFRNLDVRTDHVTDFSLGELRLYGRIDTRQNLVVPQKNSISDFRGFDQTRRPMRAVNFVADAANAMTRQFMKQALTANKVRQTDSELQSLVFHRGYSDPFSNHKDYTIQMNQIFIDKLYETNKILNITDFDSFFQEVSPFILDFAINSPYSFVAFHKSIQQDPMSCGLSVQFSNIDLSVDQEKEDVFLSDPNYPLIVEIARQYGFLVDRNAPNRLYADLASPIMLKYASAYGINSTEQVFSTSFRSINISNYDLTFEKILSLYKNLTTRKNGLPLKTRSQLKEETRFSNREKYLRFYAFLRKNEERYNSLEEKEFNLFLQKTKDFNLNLNTFLSTFENKIKSLPNNPYGLSSLVRKNGR